MHVLLTGATGYIGSSVLASLVERGHRVTAPVRGEQKARTVREAGGTGVVADFADRARLADLMRGSDAVVHVASDPDEPQGFDRRVAETAIEALAGSGKPYVHTGGVWVYGDGDSIEETDPYDPPRLTAWRPEVIALLEASDLPFTVVHPGIVYGYGRGIAGMVADGPEDADGRTLLIGSGEQHWTTVHVDDLAALYTAIVEAGGGFQDVLGVSGQSPTVAQIGAALLGEDRIAPEDPAATRERLGVFGEALLLDQQAAGDKARAIGDWRPVRPSLLDELGGA